MNKKKIAFFALLLPVIVNAQVDFSLHGGIVSDSTMVINDGYSKETKSLRQSNYTFNESSMCKGINLTTYLPIDKTTSFIASDTIALAFVHLTNIYTPVRLKAVWISPDSQEIGSYISDWTEDPAKYGYLYFNWYNLWASIRIKDYLIGNNTMWGTWSVKIFIEDYQNQIWNEETTLVFQISDSQVRVKNINISNFDLSQNFPNPFKSETFIKFNLYKQSFVSLKVFDNKGREIKTLVLNELSSGIHLIKFNADDLPCGIYYYQLRTDDSIDTRKLSIYKR